MQTSPLYGEGSDGDGGWLALAGKTDKGDAPVCVATHPVLRPPPVPPIPHIAVPGVEFDVVPGLASIGLHPTVAGALHPNDAAP